MAYFSVHMQEPQSRSVTNRAYLIIDNWNDYNFLTGYSFILFDKDGKRHHIGYIKIGKFCMGDKRGRPELPKEFDKLDKSFFSLGQDDSYYENLNNLEKFNNKLREGILCALRDVAFDQSLFKQALEEDVTQASLLRIVHPSTVTGQFHRLAKGGVRLTDYNLEYTAPPSEDKAFKLSFAVNPESSLPTNIHVLIGRNGVGKTRLLNNMARAVVDNTATPKEVGTFSIESDGNNDSSFSGIVFVTFSAFDEFEPPPDDSQKKMNYAYVGLKSISNKKSSDSYSPKTADDLTDDFVESSRICKNGAKLERWKKVLMKLNADSIFRDAMTLSHAKSDTASKGNFEEYARNIFNNLSSGHKIVLLTITKLVETVEEKTLILLDEPEGHLHPPLLSSFIRALSELLIDRNGVALIATHSPVVLQEVPKSCVWVIRRKGTRVDAERPEINTFGENVGILTREIFGLEVTRAGFHQMLQDAVEKYNDYDEVVAKFGDEIGFEGRAIIQALLATKKRPEDENS